MLKYFDTTKLGSNTIPTESNFTKPGNHGLKRGARDVSTAAKLELRLDFSRTLLILARDGFFQKLLFKIHVYGIEPPGASRSISFQAMLQMRAVKKGHVAMPGYL